MLVAVSRELAGRTGIRTEASRARTVGGGSINQAFKLPGDPCPVFLKVNNANSLSAFEAEAHGLQALAGAGGLAVPAVIDAGRAGDAAYLALEWIDFGGRTALAERRLGAGLARQHRATADQFGWHRHNTIGATPQRNTQTADWIEFLRRERLGFQLDLAARRGLPGDCARARGDCSRAWKRFSPATDPGLRCCMAICGPATGVPTQTGVPISSIPPSTMATGRPIWR